MLAAVEQAPTIELGNRVAVATVLKWWRLRRPPHQRSDCQCLGGGVCGSTESLARVVDVSRSTMHRRLRIGTLCLDEADEWALRLGVPPSDIWPEWAMVAAVDLPELSPCLSLGTLTVPGDPEGLMRLFGRDRPVRLGVGLDWSRPRD